MSEQELAELAALAEGLSPERRRELERHLPPYEARDKYENGYLKGLQVALAVAGSAGDGVREMLGVAAAHILARRPQIEAIRAEAGSPEARQRMEEESRRMLAGEIELRPMDGLLAWMDEQLRKGEAKSA